MRLPLLLTDGSVMVQSASNTSDWWRLTPDAFGDYSHGTWTRLASLPGGYSPTYFASVVLADGRVIVEGGEYNFGVQLETNLGAIYDPTSDVWTTLPPPAGWLTIGDAPCAVLPDGRFVTASVGTSLSAILDPVTLTWTPTGTGKADAFEEEGWTLLRDGSVLTLDTAALTSSERLVPSLGTWVNAGSLSQPLAAFGTFEIGPAVLRPDGTVFATGATGHTAIYTPGATPTGPGTWTPGPDFPVVAGQQLDIADGPACLLPNGNVLCLASPGTFQIPATFFEFDGTNLNPAPGFPALPSLSSFVGNMLMLPSGQVMFTYSNSDVELYTPAGAPNPAWRPAIMLCPNTLAPGTSFILQGAQLNGLSQCSAFGDDNSNATNYPIVRVTNTATRHVFYCRTSNHSSMGVATGAVLITTNVSVPANIEAGPSVLEVVANGIPSAPFAVTVNPPAAPTIQRLVPDNTRADGPIFPLFIQGNNFQAGDKAIWTVGGVSTTLQTSFANATELIATVPPALIANRGLAIVNVVEANGNVSNGASFTVTNPLPVLSTFSPGAVSAGTTTFTLTVNGSNFINGSTVDWTAGTTTTPLATTYVSPSQLNAVVPSALVTTAGTASISVVTPAPGGGTSGSLGITIGSPLSLSSLNPNTVRAGTTFTMALGGAGFLPGITVLVNNTPVPFTLVSSQQISASIPGSVIPLAGLLPVTVVNPGGATASQTFQVQNPVPTISSLSPASVKAGSPTFTLTINGTNFVTTSQARWNGANLPTTYVSATQIQATISASLITKTGNFTLTVQNPNPAGGGSNGVNLVVN